jgi:hypothetical protein
MSVDAGQIAELIKAHRLNVWSPPSGTGWHCKTCEFSAPGTDRAFEAEAHHQADVIVAALERVQ